MSIPENTIYPRTGDRETVYLKNVVTDPNITVGDWTMYNDFVNDPRQFERNNVLYHYPVNRDRLVIGKFCSIACGARFLFTSANHTLRFAFHLSIPAVFRGMGAGQEKHNRRLGQPGRYHHRQRCVDRLRSRDPLRRSRLATERSSAPARWSPKMCHLTPL